MASLGPIRTTVLGHTYNTLTELLSYKKVRAGLRGFSGVAFEAVLGRAWPMDRRSDAPGVDVPFAFLVGASAQGVQLGLVLLACLSGGAPKCCLGRREHSAWGSA